MKRRYWEDKFCTGPYAVDEAHFAHSEGMLVLMGCPAGIADFTQACREIAETGLDLRVSLKIAFLSAVSCFDRLPYDKCVDELAGEFIDRLNQVQEKKEILFRKFSL